MRKLSGIFIYQDVSAHARIIHNDFVCIENNGSIVDRNTYLKNWATDYENADLDTFYHIDEFIRIFKDIALVRSKTIFKKTVNEEEISGVSIYTDTDLKENGVWKCIQAYMTPVK